MMNTELEFLQGQQLFCEKFVNAISVPPINAVGVCVYEVWRYTCEVCHINASSILVSKIIKKRTFKG